MIKVKFLSILFLTCCFVAPIFASKPNIVIFFTDDLGWGDLGSYGHPIFQTPNLDRLASEGQRWTSFYVAESVCSPSRAALLTGRLPVRSGLYGRKLPVFFENDPYGFPEAEITLAEILKENGYTTAIIGKWHLGDKPASLPTRHGFDYWMGIPYSNDMEFVKGPSRDDIIRMLSEDGHEEEMNRFYDVLIEAYAHPKASYWDIPLYQSWQKSDGFEDRLVEKPFAQDKFTERITDDAVHFINENHAKPFLLYVPYVKPHTPIFPGKPFRGKSQGGLYGDAISEIDWSVGEIVNALKKNNVEKQTLVFFTSDNGPLLHTTKGGGSAGPFRGGKRSTFEGGLRVPAIFWWPGTISPGVIRDMGATLDIVPTILELTNIKRPNVKLDGFSLTGPLLRKDPSPRTFFPYYSAGRLWAYRSGLYKAQIIKKGKKISKVKHELIELEDPILYHLGFDPGETTDVAQDNPKVVKKIKKEIDRFRKRLPVAEPLFDRRLLRKPTKPKTTESQQ